MGLRWTQSWVHLVSSGDLAGSVERSKLDIEAARHTAPTWVGLNRQLLGLARFFGGDWAAARAELDTAVAMDFESFLDRVHPSSVLVARAYAGESDALDLAREQRARLLQIGNENPVGVWEQLLAVVESLAVLGQGGETADLYPLVRRGLDKGVVISFQLRLWQMIAGIAAACGERWDAAQDHFETALEQAQELPHRIARPETRRWYARMLVDRDLAGDRDRARALLGEAAEQYRDLGMPKHLEMAERVLASS